MPTKGQLSNIWAAEFMFFQWGKERNTQSNNDTTKGEVIGSIVYDEKNQDLKVIVDKTEEES